MTIRELLNNCSFDEVMRHIGTIQYRQLTMRPFYREAWDILMHTVSIDPYDELLVTKGRDGGPWVMQCEGNAWEGLIESPIVIEDGVKCCKERLLAQCLWHLTFYGFSPEEQHRKFEDIDRDMPKTHRQRIARFIEKTGVENRKDLYYLYRTRRFNVVSFHSRTYGQSPRMVYLTESILLYGGRELIKGPQLGFVIYTNSKTQLSDQEETELRFLLKEIGNGRRINLLAKAVNDDLADEVKILVINSKQ